ncbi:MAG: hypothetical protein WCI57_05050 [Candidatus Berkelbacteria bacterium]
MSEFSPGPQFLKEKYDLHNAPEVQRSANFVSNESGENLNSPDEKIGAYLERLEGFFEDEDPQKRERKVSFLKNKLFDLLITKPENVPASYDDFIINVIEEHGERGDWDRASDQEKVQIRQSNVEGLLSDQKDSLETWVDYLSSDDAMYPTWLKYWAFRSIANLQDYEKPEIDKETGQRKGEGRFPQRSKGTLKMFPDLNYEALSYVLDNINLKYQNQSPEIPYDIQEDEKTRFQSFLKNENFAKLYAWAIENINPIDEELLQTTDGDWVKYNQNSDPMPLVQSIRGKGTGWCTAGVNTAKTQLEMGDFYVYYSKNQDGQSSIPRIAIRKKGDNIAEVRGIAKKQNLDPFIGDVLKDKLEEFPDKDQFLKKESDMAWLTVIKNKTKSGQALDKEDLTFLYEVDSKIQGFGYVDDPRIKELRNGRNLEADLPILFDCDPSQIARTPEQVDQNTKAYVGPLVPGVFQQLVSLEHIYTSFPEGKISRGEVEIGGLDKDQLQLKLNKVCKRANGETNISSYAQDMLDKMYESEEFKKFAQNPENIQTVRLKVGDLGFTSNPTTDQIYARAKELGLDLCPDELAPYQRLKDADQPMNNWYSIAMKQFTDRDGYPDVFRLGHNDDGLWLDSAWTDPTGEWNLGRELVFRLRQVSQES